MIENDPVANAELGTLLARVDEMRASVAGLAQLVGHAAIGEEHERYLSRCCDLLELELKAIRDYAVELR